MFFLSFGMELIWNKEGSYDSNIAKLFVTQIILTVEFPLRKVAVN